MNVVPVVVGCGLLLLTGRALVLGAASAGGDGITRENAPFFYWLCVAGGIIAAVGLFYIGLHGHGS